MADVNVFAYQGGDAANTKAASANSKTKTKDEDIVPEVDNNLQDGPIFKRSCTDCLCCPLFIVFCAGMCWALIYGVSNGDPYKLITLYDYDGNGCGYTSAVKNYPYIYWPTISYTTSITEVSYRDV